MGGIDAIVRAAVDDGDAPGVVVGIARGEDVHIVAAGDKAIEGPPMRRNTLFRIASMTKPMTAAVVLTLVKDGRLALDGPVDDLLPELADRRVLRRPDGPLEDTVPAERAITVRDLLTFTWGFGMQGAMFMAAESMAAESMAAESMAAESMAAESMAVPPWPIVTAASERELRTFEGPQPASMPDPDSWLARLGELPLLAQPGERWLYQTGAQVLGILAARAAGAPFDEVLRNRIFAPLGMDDTAFYATDRTRLAWAYERRGGRFEVTDPADGQWSRPPKFPDGGAGLVSTVDDVLRFGRMLLRGGNPVLTPSVVAQMTRDQLSPEQRTNAWPGFSFLDNRGWGYGMSVLDDGSYGWDGGQGTRWLNVPEQDLVVVVLTQRAADETGMPAVCEAVVEAARTAAR